ncbi:MAG: phosphotransferase [Armatimonadetes bacterium]|nr:phosphotransferase [Armatimonadota bacterium]
MVVERQLAEALAAWGLAAQGGERLAGDVSHRRYYRLTGLGPSSVVAMVSPLEETNKMADWVLIGQHLAHHGVAVPATLRRYDPAAVLLISDVGDTLLTAVPAPEACYQRVIEDLRRVELAAASEPSDCSPAHGRRLDEIRIRWELRRFRKVVAAPVRDLTDDELVTWKEAEDTLVRLLTGGPQSWMHRDLHARNLLLQEERIWWIDFQDAMIGPWLYDLASLLYDPYAALGPELRGRLRERYLSEVQRVHREVSASEIGCQWEAVAIQRLVHCVACYVWVAEHHGKDLYLKYLPYALARLRELIETAPLAGPLRRVLASRWEAIEARWSHDAVAC